ncbi:MAG: hypothetical protein E6K54_08130 [Gammaproteobacteria bacterium]|nr:MAG: hypothetical protein E6K54_08130 [Gammaproteobacteria bacterium]
MQSITAYQNTLAERVIPQLPFTFNPRPAANIKKGTMYNLKNYNSHALNGLQVENVTLFEKAYGAKEEKNIKCFLKGFADISSEKVRDALIDKIRSGLKEATGREFFNKDCNIMLRINGIPTCSGSDDTKSIHYKCKEAKKVFEALRSMEVYKNNAICETTPCLYNNFLHSHKEYNRLRVLPNPETNQYVVCNNVVDRTFVITETPRIHPDESIYATQSNGHGGSLNIKITGVYLKDEDNMSDTIKLWCMITRSNLVTNISEISCGWQQDDEDEDDEDDLVSMEDLHQKDDILQPVK